MSDEARERMLITEQIERAKADTGEDEDSELKSGSPPVDEGLKRDKLFYPCQRNPPWWCCLRPLLRHPSLSIAVSSQILSNLVSVSIPSKQIH